MTTQTMMIIAVVAVVWAVAFVIMLSRGKKKANSVEKFIEDNRNGAILHIYGKQIRVDGNDLSSVPSTTGNDLETIVALTPGQHTIEGIYQSTETVGVKTRNVKTEKVSFDLDVEAGHRYSAGMYFYSAEEKAQYSNGQTGKVIMEMPLTLVEGSDYIKAYIVVYQED
ncbi:MAG: hypothetical protein HXK82_04155 [Lachnospiraceae bacterium]|nr:hypothetical protein [Lachnospiraceae bacterium]